MDEWWPKIEQAFLERGWSRLEQHAQRAAKKRVISPQLAALLQAEAAYQSVAWFKAAEGAIPRLAVKEVAMAFNHLAEAEEAEGDETSRWTAMLRVKMLAATQQWTAIVPLTNCSLEDTGGLVPLELVLRVQAVFAMAMAWEHTGEGEQALPAYGAIVSLYRRLLIVNGGGGGQLALLQCPAAKPFVRAALLAYARMARKKAIRVTLEEQRACWLEAAMALRLLLTMPTNEDCQGEEHRDAEEGNGEGEALDLYLEAMEARFPQAADYRCCFELLPAMPIISQQAGGKINLTLNQSTQSLRFTAPPSMSAASLHTMTSSSPPMTFVPAHPEEEMLLCSALLDCRHPLIADRNSVHQLRPSLRQWLRRLAALPESPSSSLQLGLLGRLALSLPQRAAVACHTLGWLILALDAEGGALLPHLIAMGKDYAAMGGEEPEVWLVWARAIVQTGEGHDAYLEADSTRVENDQPLSSPSLAVIVRTWARALVLHSLGRWEEAANTLDRLLQLDEGHVGGHWLRGCCRMQLGRLGEAEDDLTRCLLLDADYGAAWQALVQLRAIGGRWEDWREALGVAEEEAGRAELWPLRLDLLKRLGMRTEALAFCRAALRLAYGLLDDDDLDGGEDESSAQQSRLLPASSEPSTINTANTATRETFIARFLGQAPLMALPPFVATQISIPGFPLPIDIINLAPLLEKRLAANHRGAQAAWWWVQTASLLLSLERAADANHCLQQANLLYPRLPLIGEMKAKLAARRGNTAEALEIARSHATYSYFLLDRLLGEGELTEAELLARQRCLNSKLAEDWHLLARTLMQRERWEEASEVLQRALELEQTATPLEVL